MDKDELYKIAKENYYRVFPFDKSTKKSDTRYIRVGIIDNPTDIITWNFFDGKKLLSNTNFDKADVFENGRAVVTKNHKMNILFDDGRLMFDEWYHSVTKLSDKPELYIVSKSDDEYGLKTQDAIFSPTSQQTGWFYRITPITDSNTVYGNICIISKNTGPHWIDHKDALYDVVNGVEKSGWYDAILPLMEIFKDVRVMRVRNNELRNLMRPDGSLVFDIWSTKQIVPDSNGVCQLFDKDGNVHNLNIN